MSFVPISSPRLHRRPTCSRSWRRVIGFHRVFGASFRVKWRESRLARLWDCARGDIAAGAIGSICCPTASTSVRAAYTAPMRWLAIGGLALALVTAGTASASHPLRTGFVDQAAFAGPSADQSVLRARRVGASIVRLALFWNVAAPQPPADPTDPGDPAYDWESMDQQVVAAARGGLDPILCLSRPPIWARGTAVGLPGTWPSPAKYAQFAQAAARRYSGTFTPTGGTVPLPRVRFWEAWNEPNAGSELAPQRVNGQPVSPAHYRRMVNAFADAVHGVNPGNLVVAGTLGPFGHDSKDIQVVAPMRFMSDLLCVSLQAPHRKTCSQRTRFDIWAHNPYTNGGPNFHAYSPTDASIGDLPEMRALLAAAKRRGTIVSAHAPDFWVTEFSWDTNPPDPRGVPSALHARWVAEALYRMWQAGVSAVIWWRLQDDPLRQTPYQSGFYTVGGQPKYSLEAFRFPFVAFRAGNGVSVWGRTPSGESGSVIVEQRSATGWISVARLRADRYGIFSRHLPATALAATALRARLIAPSESSIPFSLTVPPSRRTTPFGCGGQIPC